MAKKTPSLAVGRGEKLPVSKGAGLTAKGRAKYNAATGSNLKAPQPEGGARKKSFCARMSGMPGPMKDEKGRPTRKAASLKGKFEELDRLGILLNRTREEIAREHITRSEVQRDLEKIMERFDAGIARLESKIDELRKQ